MAKYSRYSFAQNGRVHKFAEPTVGNVRPVNPVSTSLSIGYKNENFLWERIAPVYEVNEKSATFFLDRPADFFTRQEGAERAPGAQYRRVGYTQTSDTYNTLEIGFEAQLEDVVAAASQHPENLNTKNIQFLTNLIQLELEKRAAAKFFVTGVWDTSTTLTGSDQWSDFANSDPIANADNAINTIRQATGASMVDLFIGKSAWDKLKEHPLVLDKYKHTQTGIMTPELVAPVLGVGELIVGDSVENTANVAQTFSGADIWTDSALFLVKNPAAIGVQNGAYTIVWNERGNVPWAVEDYREEQTRSDVQRVFTHVDHKVVASAYGFIYLDTVA